MGLLRGILGVFIFIFNVVFNFLEHGGIEMFLSFCKLAMVRLFR